MKSLASAEVLSETRARLLSLRAADQPLWGQMTVLQMAGHLRCSYEIALGLRTVGSIKGPLSSVLKFGALKIARRWPKNYATTPELKEAIDMQSETDLGVLVEAAIAGMEAVSDGARLADAHPTFGRMSRADWMRWGYLHADHHLRQFGR
jgi:Protein of unknown function (DUF1569)